MNPQLQAQESAENQLTKLEFLRRRKVLIRKEACTGRACPWNRMFQCRMSR